MSLKLINQSMPQHPLQNVNLKIFLHESWLRNYVSKQKKLKIFLEFTLELFKKKSFLLSSMLYTSMWLQEK